MIGPGLSRNEYVLEQVSQFIQLVRDTNKPIILDADALWLIAHKPALVKGYKKAILTPNLMEFRRLFTAMECSKHVKYHAKSEREITSNITMTLDAVVEDYPYSTYATDVIFLAKALEGVTILSKGQVDIISNGEYICYASKHGNPRRCGGQGDILSGSVATFAAWASRPELTKDPASSAAPLLALAALSGCIVTRYASRKAFTQFKRSMLSKNVLDCIGLSMEKYHPIK